MKKVIPILLLICIVAKSKAQSFYPPVGVTVSTGASSWNMTPASACTGAYLTGAIWCTTPVNFNNPFTLTFQTNVDIVRGIGADGICVVFGQNLTPTSINGYAGDIGYYNPDTATPNPQFLQSFAIEFDIFNNYPILNDPSAMNDHTMISRDGNPYSITPGSAPVPIRPSGTTIKDATYHNYKIVWCPASTTLNVYFEDSLRIVSHFDYRTIFTTTTPSVNWGITAGIGSSCSDQLIQDIVMTAISDTTYTHTDTSGCGITSISAPSGFSSYYWNTGSTSSTIPVSGSGTYWVSYADPGTCGYVVDTFHVTNTCTCDAISLPDSLHLCLGDTATLPATLIGADSVISYTWTPTTGLSSTTILNPLLTATTSGWYYLTVNSGTGNLVVNGDFTAGNTGFTTNYIVEAYGTTSTPGDYAVNTNPNLYDASWPVMGDHTTGTGNMLIVDGAYSSSEDFWCETMPVVPNTNYIFTVWTALFHVPQPTIQITINGVNISTFTTSATAGTWQQYQIIWNSSTATSASICMSDLNTTAFGNDFAIDDISFQAGCTVKDSIYIKVTASDTSFSHTDTSVCALLGTVILNAPAGYITPIWSTGATTSSVTVTDSGTYWVRTTSDCILKVDTFKIVATAPKSGSFATDTTLCMGSVATLNAPPFFTAHIWNNGDSTSSITINSAGTYWVINKSIPNCSIVIDTIHVAAIELPVVALGNDTVLCPGDSIMIGSPELFGTFLWNTGSIAPAITVSLGGTYVLTVTQNGCSASDTINIASLSMPTLNLGPDTILCKGDMFVLTAGIDSVLWSTGIMATSITVIDSSTYWASITNKCGTVRDSVNVGFEPCDLYFPSGFTPNNDGRNDVARAIGYLSKYRDYSLSIYNRWGQRIFYTEDIYAGWDGTFNGVKADIDVYFYMIFYTLEGKRGMLKGDITLIR